MHTHPHIILCSCGSRNGTSCGLRGGEQIDRTSTPRELLQGWRRVGHPPLWFAPRLPPRPSPSPLLASLVTSSSVWTVELASWAGPGRAQSPHCFVLANVLLFFLYFSFSTELLHLSKQRRLTNRSILPTLLWESQINFSE